MTSPSRSRKPLYTVAAILGFLAGSACVLYAVFTSKSSTAAIGLLFVPVYGAFAAALGCALVHVGLVAADLAARRIAWHSGRALSALLLVAGALAFASAALLYRHAHAVAADPQATPEMLAEISASWIPLWRRDVDIALAKNPATPAAILTAMVEDGRDEELVSLAGAHPATPLPVLEKIAAAPLSYIRSYGLAGNPRLTPVQAQRLAEVGRKDFQSDVEYRLYQTYVLSALVKNPATPQPLFDRIAAREGPEYFLAVAIIYANRSTCAQIARAGESGNEVLDNTARSQLKKRGC